MTKLRNTVKQLLKSHSNSDNVFAIELIKNSDDSKLKEISLSYILNKRVDSNQNYSANYWNTRAFTSRYEQDIRNKAICELSDFILEYPLFKSNFNVIKTRKTKNKKLI